MRKIYGIVCKIEEFFVKYALVTVAVLIFVSAIARSIREPLNWATDVSLILFAWIIFLGADVALRHGELVNVDIIINKFTPIVKKSILLLWNVLIIGLLIIMIRFGIPLAIESVDRIFNTLGISYSWATISVPTGSLLMLITICIKTYNLLRPEKMSGGS
ncbi:TRAP transporter small permease [Bacillus weihaiensis]|uniref:Tripartite ATP-independent periplasmic transporters DctQ component domain-containing protein n=1 Tax=Bacillus weihaiensis TaxID=1547283 RepID=A0A1L3MMV5_9BACI|nr:TRAP transporter small permease subunit [Bacillus weihaiensis]APH03690.1 hypothetical protein A9C19_02350 [Bacillus weihaiensis]